MTDKSQIKKLGPGLRKYRTEIPNMVLDSGLTVYELVLYVHLKRTAGDHGASWKGTRTLAEETGMSMGSVSKAKAGLEQRGLITISQIHDKSQVDYIEIVDIWEDNFLSFQGVHQVNGIDQETDKRSPGEWGCSPGERKNKHIKELNKNKLKQGEVYQTYEQEIGLLTPLIAEEIGYALDDYPVEWIHEALRISAKYNKRSWKYVEAILKNWESEGRGDTIRPRDTVEITAEQLEKIAKYQEVE